MHFRQGTVEEKSDAYTSYRANRAPMAAAAERILEQDVLARVDRDAVILVPHPRVQYGHTVRVVDIKRIRVVAQRAPIGVELVAGGIVANHVLHYQVIHIIDAEEVLGRVLDVDAVKH